MRCFRAVTAAGVAGLLACTAQASIGSAPRSPVVGDEAAFSGPAPRLIRVNATTHRRCDFIRDPTCAGTWSAPARSVRSPRNAAPSTSPAGDADAPSAPDRRPLGVAAAGCPPGNTIGTKGECVEPKPVATACPPGNVLGTKGECVHPLPMTIPEPGTLSLVALGLAAVLALMRRRSPIRPR